MSEYQYYEFRTIDRSLTKEEMAQIRAFTTRAEITPTSFTNEYHWGDFKGDPMDMMARYYDAHVYTANWGPTSSCSPSLGGSSMRTRPSPTSSPTAPVSTSRATA